MAEVRDVIGVDDVAAFLGLALGASALGESRDASGGREARAPPSSWRTRTPAQARMPEAQRIRSAEKACADARWPEIRK
jgi:hypothetical protein